MVLHQFEQGVVKIGRYPLIFRSEYGKRRRAQLGFDIGMAGKSLDEGANFLTLSSRRRREFNSHAETGVHYPHCAVCLGFHSARAQKQGYSGTLGKWRVGFNVAGTQAQVGQFTVGSRFQNIR